MVQSINTKALLTLASILRRPSLLSPHVSVANVSQINYGALAENGIAAIVYDKDNTLTAPYDLNIHRAAENGLKEAIRVFGRENVAILSNSAGTRDDRDYRDANAIEQSIGIAVIRHDEKKPGALKEVLDHFQIQESARICMIGDRILTDIVFGNLYGMLTIHTLPLVQGEENMSDNWTAKLIRPLENQIVYRAGWASKKIQQSRLPHKYWNGTDPLTLKSS